MAGLRKILEVAEKLIDGKSLTRSEKVVANKYKLKDKPIEQVQKEWEEGRQFTLVDKKEPKKERRRKEAKQLKGQKQVAKQIRERVATNQTPLVPTGSRDVALRGPRDIAVRRPGDVATRSTEVDTLSGGPASARSYKLRELEAPKQSTVPDKLLLNKAPDQTKTPSAKGSSRLGTTGKAAGAALAGVGAMQSSDLSEEEREALKNLAAIQGEEAKDVMAQKVAELPKSEEFEETTLENEDDEKSLRIAANSGVASRTRKEEYIAKKYGLSDVTTIREDLRAAKLLLQSVQELAKQSPQKADWFQSRFDSLQGQLNDARQLRAEALKTAESEAERKEAILAWGQVADIIGKGLIQLGAAQHGLRTGYDLSGLQFSPTNWDAKYARIDKALNRQINAAEKRFEDVRKEVEKGTERLFKEKDVAEERTWREEQADKELKARKKIEEDRFNRQLEKLGMENKFAKAMEETKHQNRLEVETLKGQFKPGDRAGARQLRKSLQKKREAAESLKGENGFDLLQKALKSKKPTDKDRFRKLLRDAGLEPVSTEEILDKADGWFSNDIEAYNEFLDKHIEENLSDSNFSDMIEESPTGPAAPGADVIRADSAEDLDQLF